jgi:hypothetical protein
MKSLKFCYLLFCGFVMSSFIVAYGGDSIPEALPITKVVYGTVNNPSDFSGSVTLTYDADSVYMQYVITDDSIVNFFTGTDAYTVDNIEIYFDMDNSKNIHWPRNGNWIKEIDDSYDINDFQIRLVPGIAFSVYNFARYTDVSITSGYRVEYSKNDTGYSYIFNIAWNTLLNGFSAEVGTKIGFDILASDNDRYSNVAFRNQITWNCTTDKPYNDPSLFGTLELAEGGVFHVVPDTSAPSVPGNFAAQVDSNQITLTWDASVDSIAVMKYIIYKNDDSLTTVYGLKTGNSLVLRYQKKGDYSFKIKAVDNYDNSSDFSPSVEATVVFVTANNSVEAENKFINYPNPVNNTLYIDNASSIVSLEILGINGSVVSKVTNSSAGYLTINTSNLSSGEYLIRITTTDEQVVMGKMVKE